MKVLGWLLGISTLLVVLLSHQAAASPSGILVAQVMPNGSTATQEYVSIYNTSDSDIDITGWCVKYNGSSSKPGCITAPDTQTRLYLAARAYTTFASTDFLLANPGFIPQARAAFSPGMADAGGVITLVDQNGTVQDQFAWSKKLSAGMVYQRVNNEQGIMQDTDIDGVDFVTTDLVLPAPEQLSLYEYAPPVDMCTNLPEAQGTIPEGYMQNDTGDCVQDICPNIDGLQQMVPAGYMLEGADCVEAPRGTAVIDITELLPNPASYDTGLEFVEVYNPNDREVDLVGYRLELGPAYTKTFTFPSRLIAARDYLTLTDTELGFSLPNSGASIRLKNAAGQIVSETPSYDTAPEAESWSLISDFWEFTSIPTPGAMNQSTPIEEAADSGASSLLAPCPAGKYRNLDTNRCRNIVSAASSLKPCAADEYRNASTNRCRKLTTLSNSSLTPCKPGQVRNPETNRCRNATATSSTIKPCEAGYERNSDTNRCRKVSTSPAQFSEEPAQTRAANNVLITVMLILTVGYGAYEYRYDAVNLYHKLRMRWQKRQASRVTQNPV
ncbi:lamin tail domain-containing protein [Candidatus Saccharibacteria bacterium]|nr:lamin tail domain-containing protein [Candidatus Saccharibacteria bacterium]